MQHVIRNSNGRFVAKGGSESTFTTSLLHARKFDNYEDAKINCCGNEHPEQLERLLDAYRR